MSDSIIGPNCNVGPDTLRENLVICAGETASDLVRACAPLGGPTAPMREYKCYRFWQFEAVTVVWTGIGTGCLEPLLWEVLKRADVVRRIMLVGTAGRLREDVPQAAYAIDRALLGQTAISGRLFDQWSQYCDDVLSNGTAVSTQVLPLAAFVGLEKALDRA